MTTTLAFVNTLCTVSVVIPCFNTEKTLREAVASAQAQEGVTVQIIAVDDGSCDATAEILEGLAASGQLELISLPHKGGAPRARNRGLAQARGEFVQFLDADDCLLAGKLRHQCDLLQQHGADFVAGAYAFNNLAGETSHQYPAPEVWLGLLQSRLGRTSANLFRRKALLALGGWNETQKSSQEYELMFRLLANGYRAVLDGRVATQIHSRDGSISNSDGEGNAVRFIQLRQKIVGFLRQQQMITPTLEAAFQQLYHKNFTALSAQEQQQLTLDQG